MKWSMLLFVLCCDYCTSFSLDFLPVTKLNFFYEDDKGPTPQEYNHLSMEFE